MTELQEFIKTSDRIVILESKFQATAQTLISLSLYASRLQELWEDIQVVYKKVVQNPSDDSTCASISEKYETVFGIYATMIGKIDQLTKDLTLSPQTPPHAADLPSVIHTSGNNHASVSHSTPLPRLFDTNPLANNLSFTHSMVVPPCDIPTFKGTYDSWPTFRDLFTAVFIRNGRLSDVERLFHLLHRTSGEAKSIVQKYPLTDCGFNLAWAALASSYENSRSLVNNQLSKWFSLSSVSKETNENIKKLQHEINSSLELLKLHHVKVNDWDPILVYLCCQRLPDPTFALWEQSLTVKTSLPSWSQLDEFLTIRAKTLESIEETKRSTISSVSTHSRPFAAPLAKTH